MRRALSLTIAMTAGMLALAAAPASAQTFNLTATLTGAGEATEIANGVNTGAFGDAVIVLNVGTQTLTYTIRVWNLPSGITGSHIHVGSEKTAGPVVVNFTVVPNSSNDFSLTGTVAFSAFTLRPDQGIRSPEDMVQAILGNNTYINVHSTVNPGGEVRGQLILKP